MKSAIAYAAGILCAVVRAALWWQMSPGNISWWQLALLLILGVLLGSASSGILPLQGPRRGHGLYSLLLFCAILLVPYVAPLERFTLPALLCVAAVCFWPLSWPRAEATRWPSRYLAAMAGVVLAVATVATVAHLSVARPYVGSVDFFYYVCTARDMLLWPEEVAPSAYRYFPGVYAWWRAILHANDGSLGALQVSVLFVLVINAIAIAGVVVRGCGRWLPGIYAAVWYVLLASRFQGLAGTTEPLATVPFLLALWVWGGQPLRGVRGVAFAISLGIGLGLALWMKQFAGLLSLGAIWLLITWWLAQPHRSHDLRVLALLPPIAGATLIAAVLTEGRGLEPLKQGLGMVGSYGREASWLWNLYVQVRGDETAALAAGGVLVALTAMVIRRRYRRWLGAPWLELAGVAGLSGTACLLQFTSRAHGHYAMLAMPSLVIAAVLLAVQLVGPWWSSRRRTPLMRGLVLLLAVWPLLHHDGDPRAIPAWRLLPATDWQPNELWYQRPAVAADLGQLRRERHVFRGESMFCMPTRHHSPHFLLGTHSLAPWGYSFELPQANQVDWSRFDGVLILVDELDPSDQAVWNDQRRKTTEAALLAAGFRPAVALPTMVLFRPTDADSRR